MYPAVAERTFLYVLIRSSWLRVSSCSLFSLIFCPLILSIFERGVEVSNYDLGIVFFFLYFATHTFQHCCLVHIHLGLLCLFSVLAILSLHNIPFCLVIFLALKSLLSDINIATPASR